MYLKSIEIQGFKSFANKLLFEFHNGITGIVGPNGSGKSNVADAVRWVLGEQRIKQLRGASMQDVIFAGTETRKPQGFAYVAITLDNSDHQLAIEYGQVTVARRIYRSGESEYLINGSACRLKDIYELFYDTGIGKEGYSIIGQGQIDKILSGKPEERRELFDEAAGIVKFKRRKAIAQKKLENEKQNLVRVSDILNELHKQVGPLARQSEAAREYLRLRDQLKTYDANLFLLEAAAIRSQMAQLGERESMVAGDLEQSRAESGQLKAQYDALGEQLAALEAQMDGERQRLNQAEVLKGSLEGQINVLNEQINTEKMHSEHIKARMQAIDQALVERDGELTGYRHDSDELGAAAGAAAAKLREAEDKLRQEDESLSLLEHQIEEAKAQVIAALNEKAAIGAREQRFEAMLEQVQVRRSEVLQKILKYKSDEEAQEELRKLEADKLAAVAAWLYGLETARGRLNEAACGLENEARSLGFNLNKSQQSYHAAYTKLESLKNIAERYEGYGNSIRRVMEAKGRIRGIHGVVADLFTTRKEYEMAIETALGGAIQNVVTDSEQTAKQLIEYLKKNKYGRATFLPLTSVNQRGGFTQPEALTEPGVIGLADGLIQVKPEYAGLARYLLGRVVVAENIDYAIALAKKYRYTLRVVTLEGELFSAGGSMTGGAFKNSSNLLGRKREIEELEAACEKALQAVERLRAQLKEREGALADRKEELEQCKAQIVAVSLEQNTIQMGLTQLTDKCAEIADSAADLVLENRQLESQIRDIDKSRKDLSASAGRARQLNARLEQQIETQGQQLDEGRRRRAASVGAHSALQLEAAGLKQKADFVTENIRRVREEQGKLKEERQGLKSGTDGSAGIIEGKLKEIEGLGAQILEVAREREDAASKVRDCEASKEAIAAGQKHFFERREQLSERVGQLDKDLFRIQNQMEKQEEKLEHSVTYLWNEYELTFSTAEALRDPQLSQLSELRGQIDGIKQGIKALGNINVNAIEDYKEISERYGFMKTQHEDLIQAEQALLQIIEELDTGMRRQFEEKFREIRREFDKVFRELFGGGHGTLELMEGEDILEAGIQIISQPPGKKLQNMMQLSGGEKALTAIALLFAIQNLKPSPFCLLDEIEAALDDSNVDRFAGYLHKLTKHTQFIVITHRRGTMVASDRLYGITMQEKGVSTLVSVNLIENELDH